jgi:tRNA(Ile)-lysidine synthase
MRDRDRWIPVGSRAVLGVSGGSDSMALLGLMASLAPEWHIDASVLHVHHGLRGEDADRDAELVAEWSQRLGLPCRVARVSVSAGRGQSWEMAARAARRAALLAEAGPDGWVVLAHHRDDQAETVLYRVLRGTGVAGAAGMRPVAGRVVRPLLSMSREDLRRWRVAAGIPAREDATNRSLVPVRNRLRHKLLPQLRRQYNPRVDDALIRLAESAAELDAWASAAAADLFAARWNPNAAPGCHRLRAVRTLPPPLLDRVLRRAAGDLGFSLTEAQVRATRGDAAGWPRRHQVWWEGDDLWIVGPGGAAESAPDPGAPILVAVPGETAWRGGRITVAAVESAAERSVTSRVKGDVSALYARPRAPGDRMAVSVGTKKLQDVFVDAHVPAPLRSGWPVLTADPEGQEIVVVPGLAVAARFQPLAGEAAWAVAWHP